MSPKERVRVNVYKALLEEEKRKNKRKSYISVSVFVIGIFAGSLYNFMPSENIQSFEQTRNFASEMSDNSFKSNVEVIDNFFSNTSIEHDENKELKTDEYFVMNMQV